MSALRIWWIVAVFALFMSADPSEAQGKRYFVDAVDIDASVTADGAVQIEESLTYRYRGDFTYGFRDIPRSKGMGIDQFAVLENGVPFRQADDRKATRTSSERPAW